MDTRDTLYLSNHWWVLTVRGIATILFGIAAVFWPGLTLVTLLYLFSALILVYGVVDIVEGLLSVGREGIGWILTLVLGFLQVGVGIYLLRHTLASFTTLILLIGLTLVARGVFETVSAFFSNDSTTERTLTIIGAVVSALAGIIIMRSPVASGVAFVWVLGVFALIVGPILIATAIDTKHSLEVQSNSSSRSRASRA